MQRGAEMHSGPQAVSDAADRLRVWYSAGLFTWIKEEWVTYRYWRNR